MSILHKKLHKNSSGSILLISKRAQVWYLDLFLGIIIFVFAITLFFKSEVNISQQDDLDLYDIRSESRIVSQTLLSQGIPDNWTILDVREIGITSGDYHVSQEKLDDFLNLAKNNYSLTKTLLRTKYDYYIFFVDQNRSMKVSASDEGIGKQGYNSTIIEDMESNNLVKVTRIVIYRSKPVKMVLYLWN